jgi:tRNA threonylcarbamoyladenosine biosynthesis protein TsaE
MKISSEQEMIDYGKQLAKEHKILLLEGDLWAGKTALTKWLAQGRGCDVRNVQSPTYAYLNIYDNKVLHIDMYRIQSFEDIVKKWILNQIHEHEYIVIERPKFINQLGVINYTVIHINKLSETEREVTKKDPKQD